MIRLQVGVGLKYALIVVVTTAVCFGLYELVRQVPVLRFLMGMKAG